jgi:type VI secretion system secreted protein VgrG
MAQRNFSLSVPGIELSPREFEVVEGLSQYFQVDVVGKIADTSVDLEAMVGKPASFRISSDRLDRYWSGVVAAATQLKPEPRGISSYAVSIMPTLWLTEHVKSHRVFQHESIPDIVEKVLKPYQITPKKKLQGEHPKHEYVVQYGETDYEFVTRLLAQDGITYYFEHKPGESKLVLDDAPHQAVQRSGGAIEYVIRPNPESKAEYLTCVALSHAVAPGKVTVRDYDFRKPDFRLEGTAQRGDDFEKKLEQYIYAPGLVLVEEQGGGEGVQDDQGKARHKQEEGNRLAERLLAAARQSKRSVRFETNAYDLAPGLGFTMKNHPHPDLGKKLFVSQMYISGAEVGNWLFFGSAEFSDDAYVPAPPRQARIAGVQSAIVVGPKNEEIYTDEHARVRVQLQWDREGKGVSEGKPSSCWMRVGQPWAGKGWGVINVPRIGHEVLVRYLDGHPDHPVVTGRVYNKLQPVGYTLPKHKAKTLWKSDSSKHADNHYNELRFDDRKDFELVYLQAQKDRQELVKRNETERTGTSRAHAVGRSRSAIVRKKDVVLVGREYSLQMMEKPSDRDMQILADRDTALPPQKKPRLTPKATKLDMMDKKIMATTGDASVELDDDEIIFEAKGEISIRAGQMVIVKGGDKIKINC